MFLRKNIKATFLEKLYKGVTKVVYGLNLMKFPEKSTCYLEKLKKHIMPSRYLY